LSLSHASLPWLLRYGHLDWDDRRSWLAVPQNYHALPMMLGLVNELRDSRFGICERHLSHMTNMT
jgi:hypothetical protein